MAAQQTVYSFRNQELESKRELCSSLQKIWGIGWLRSLNMTGKLGFAYPFFTYKLNPYYFTILNYILNNQLTSKVKAQRSIQLNIKALINLNSYKGKRHKLNLPVRGQRTRTNARTQKRLKLNTNI